MKYNWMKSATLAVALAGIACSAMAAGPLAAKVNGVEITAQEVNEINEQIAKKSGFPYKPGVLTEELIVRELLAQEAIRRGADRNGDRQALARSTFNEYAAANPLGEADVKREYDRLKAGATKKLEYKISFILVKTEAEAKNIIAGLNSGKPFASFVPQSIDENSKRDGGSLGWTDLDTLSPEYIVALRDMKAGTHSKQPIGASYGYGVVRMDEIREEGFPAYADIRDSLIESVRKQWRERLIKPLRDKATIQVFDGYKNDVIDLRNFK